MVAVVNVNGEKIKNVDLPTAFSYPIRRDLINLFVNAYMSNSRTPYGTYWFAGNRRVGHNLGPNHGIARYPRVAGTTRGVMLANARGGRSAHHPVVEKVWEMKINEKQKKLAKLSALSATSMIELVRGRGHRFKAEEVPVVVENKIEEVEKAEDLTEILKKIGVYDDVIRAKEGTKIRAGRGKSRNRPYRTPKSILLVVKDKSKIGRAARNLAGVDVKTPNQLNAYVLAPGAHPGRLMVITEGALDEIRGWNF